MIEKLYRLLRSVGNKHSWFRRLAIFAYDFLSQVQSSRVQNFFGVPIKFPSRHPMSTFLDVDAVTNSFLGTISSHVFTEDCQEYIDLGANIGDSAIVIEYFSRFKIRGTLVEPSKFFFPYLVANAVHLNQPTLLNSFASTFDPPKDLHGKLMHWTGNAEVVSLDSSKLLASKKEQVTVSELMTPTTKLVKIDCEGQDVLMISSYLFKPRINYPVFFFELTIKSQTDIADLIALVEVAQAHYTEFIAMKNSHEVLDNGKLDLGFVNKVVDLWETEKEVTLSGQLQLEIAFFPNEGSGFQKVLAALSGTG